MWPINNWYYGGGIKQLNQATLQTLQDGEHYFTIENVKVKNWQVMLHILSETTRDESTLAYADNGI